MSWPTVPLGEAVVARAGSVTPNKFPGEEFELYSIPAHDRGGPEVIKGFQIGSAKQFVLPGDVMISKIIPHIRRVRIVNGDTGRRQIASGEWIVCRSDRYAPSYLRHFLLSDHFHRQFMGTVAGVGGSLVRARPEYVKAIEVPTPPLEEQRRIAAILDRADALLAKRSDALADVGVLSRDLFLNAVRDTVETRPLADCGVDFISGKSVLGSDSNHHPTNRVLKVNAISSGVFVPSESKPMPLDYHPPAKHLVLRGDILFGRASGSIDLLGATAVVDTDCDCLFLPDKVWKLELRHDARVIPDYVLGVLRSDHFRAYVRHRASGAAGVRNIARSTVLGYEAPLPPIALQRTYAGRVQAVRDYGQRMTAATGLLGHLFASLQSRAFRGEL